MMRFTRDELDEYLTDPVFEEAGDQRRWSCMYTIIFKAEDGNLYLVYEDRGLTEYQENEFPDLQFDNDKDGEYVECPEVELYEEMRPVTKWRLVK